MIVYARTLWLSLWESWHAVGVTERGTIALSDLAFRRATSPKGRGKGAAAPAQLTKIKYHFPRKISPRLNRYSSFILG